MHTPQGHEMRDGVAFPVDWLAIIFNPSFPYRFSHMLIASGLTAAFLVAGISAYRLLKGDDKQAPKLTLKIAVTVAALLTPLQIFMGDMHGLNTLEHQPQKIAAMEGIWHTEKGAPLLLFALPDEANKTNHYEVAIPKMASFILTHDLNGEVKGLNEFVDNHPPVRPVFFAFRIMVGIGMLMLVIAWLSRIQLWRNKPLPPWLLKALVMMSFSGWIATLAGWYVTEIGRQPWLVSGILTVKDAATTIPASNVGLSLVMYLTLYVIILIAYLHTIFTMANRAVEIEEITDEERVKPIVKRRIRRKRNYV
jgi:cytochrome d ubiquinol oxidase subunit I